MGGGYELSAQELPWHEKTPLFVIGAPRSGTTFLCRLLRAHPSIWITNESAVFLQMHHLVASAAERRPAGYESAVESKELYAEWSSYLDRRAPELIRGFYARIAVQEGRKGIVFWGDKHPHHDVCMLSLLKWFPDARFVYLVRNPLDVTCSIAAMNRWTHQEAFREWVKITGNYERYLTAVASPRLFVVRYEELANRVLPGLRKLFSWLGVARGGAAEGTLRRLIGIQSHALHTQDESVVAVLDEAEKHDAARSSIGRWKGEMSNADVLDISARAAPYLAKYYSGDGD